MAELSPELANRIQSLEGSYADNPGRYFVALAGAWREAGEPGRAEEILRENSKLYHGLSAHVLLGRCLADRGAYQEAANEFHYVLSIDSQNLIALRTLAEMAAAGGRGDEATRWYNELLAVDPMNAEARQALSNLARSGADAATVDQPVQVGSDWPAAGQGSRVAGAASSGFGDDGDEADGGFGMIDLGAGGQADTEAAPAGDWGDISLDDTAPPASTAPAGGDVDGFGFVDLNAGADAGDASGWLNVDAREDVGESAAGSAGLPSFGQDDFGDDGLIDAPIAGGLPMLGGMDDDDDAGDRGSDDLPLAGLGTGDLALDASGDYGAGDLTLDDDTGAYGTDDLTLDASTGYGAGDLALDDGEFGGGDLPLDDGGYGGGDLPLMDVGGDAAPSLAGPEHHDDDHEVVTETMAELYASQGLHARAAEVYRELISRRGDEPGLVRRLAEIESAGVAAAPGAAPAAEAEEPAPDWLESVDAYARGTTPAGEGSPALDVSSALDDAPAVPQPLASTGDPFADSFAGGFEGADAGFHVPAGYDVPAGAAPADVPAGDGGLDFLAGATADAGGIGSPDAADGVDGDDRQAWEAPSVVPTEAQGFDLIVIAEDGEEQHVAASAEEVAHMSADWALAAAPLDDDDDEDVAVVPAGASGRTMRDYFSSLLTWQPGASAAAGFAAGASTLPAADLQAGGTVDSPADEVVAPVAEVPTYDYDLPAAEAPAGDFGLPAADAPADDYGAPAMVNDYAPPTADLAVDHFTTPPLDDATPTYEASMNDGMLTIEPIVAEEAPEAIVDEPAAADGLPFMDDGAPVMEAAALRPADDEPWAAPAAPAEAPPAAIPDLDDEPWAFAPPAAPEPVLDLGTLAPPAAQDEAVLDLGSLAPSAAPEPVLDLGAFTLSDDVAAAGPAAAEPADEDLLPWEVPAEPAAPAAPEPAANAGDLGAFSFEDFFAAGPSGATPAPAPEPAPPSALSSGFPELDPTPPSAFAPPTPPPAFVPPAPPPAPAPAAPAPQAAAEPGEEDEDLESFQAWLQSLKR